MPSGDKISATSDTNLTRARDGDPWIARFNFNKKTYTAPLNTTDRREALKLAAKFVAIEKARLNVERDKGLRPMALGEACDLWLENTVRRSLNTKARVEILRRQTGDAVLIEDLSGKHVEDMMEQRRRDTRPAKRSPEQIRDGILARQTISPVTANLSVDLLRSIVMYAVERQNATPPKRPIKWDIFKQKIERRANGHLRRRALHEDKRDAILDAIHPAYLGITRFALLTGLRATECLLTWPQIDWNAQPHPMVRNVFGKGHRDHGREIELVGSAVAVIRAEMGKHPVAVFTYCANRSWTVTNTSRHVTKGEHYPITYAGWKIAWARMLDKLTAAGHSPARIHDLRHTFATTLANDPEMSVFAVMGEMGHADPKTTMGYVSPNTEAGRNAKQRIILPGIGKGLREVSREIATNCHKIAPHTK